MARTRLHLSQLRYQCPYLLRALRASLPALSSIHDSPKNWTLGEVGDYRHCKHLAPLVSGPAWAGVGSAAKSRPSRRRPPPGPRRAPRRRGPIGLAGRGDRRAAAPRREAEATLFTLIAQGRDCFEERAQLPTPYRTRHSTAHSQVCSDCLHTRRGVVGRVRRRDCPKRPSVRPLPFPRVAALCCALLRFAMRELTPPRLG